MPGMRWTTKINYQLVIGWKVGPSIMQMKLQWSVTIFQGVCCQFWGERNLDSKDLPKKWSEKHLIQRVYKKNTKWGWFFAVIKILKHPSPEWDPFVSGCHVGWLFTKAHPKHHDIRCRSPQGCRGRWDLQEFQWKPPRVGRHVLGKFSNSLKKLRNL